MSLYAPLITFIPDDTERVAHAAFPHGNRYLRLRDALGPLFYNPDFAPFFAHEGRPAVDPARLALITILQFAERLSDEQAADAVRSRIDWKYLLALPLTDPGFDSSVLSEFRTRLLAAQAETLLFDTLLTQFREAGLLRARGRQRTDSTHVLAAVCALNRLECVGNTFRQALNHLAVVAPDWLVALSQPECLKRYGHRIEDYRLPQSKDDRLGLATQIGADGLRLLQALDAAATPEWLRRIPAVQTLRRVWLQNYTWATPATLRWRADDEIPPSAQYISSPYDTEARYSLRRTTSWVGYKIHLTETCDADAPHLITNVATTAATTGDEEMLVPIHQALAGRDLLPAVHLADMGFIDAELLVEIPKQYEVDLLGPVRADYRRQAREGQGFANADFVIDWTAQRATCPMGQHSSSWTPARDSQHNEVIKIKFSQRVCQACPVREQCSDSTRRTITIRPQAQYIALHAARARQRTADFRREYRARAGIEGTISQAVRRCSVRQARYVGEAKTHLQHLATASAINLIRVSEWLDDQPRAKPRYSAFERLYRIAA